MSFTDASYKEREFNNQNVCSNTETKRKEDLPWTPPWRHQTPHGSCARSLKEERFQGALSLSSYWLEAKMWTPPYFLRPHSFISFIVRFIQSHLPLFCQWACFYVLYVMPAYAQVVALQVSPSLPSYLFVYYNYLFVKKNSHKPGGFFKKHHGTTHRS